MVDEADSVPELNSVPVYERWFLEAGFGRVDDPDPRTFADLNEAQAWIIDQL